MTIGIAPSGGLQVREELRLLKVGLLYGDAVRLCAPGASMLMTAATLAWLKPAVREQAVLEVLDGMADEKTRAYLARYRHLQPKTRKSKEDLLFLMQAAPVVRASSEEARVKLAKMVSAAGGNGLHEAITSGFVVLEKLDDEDKMAATLRYFDIVRESVANGTTYPLLDDRTGALLRLAIRAGVVAPSDAAERLGRIAGLAADVLNRLPLFEDAEIVEILQLRRELRRPLGRFRSAITTFSADVAAAQWDSDFRAESEALFRARVAPVIADLEDEIHDNTLAGHLLKRVVLPYKQGALGAIIGELLHLGDLSALASGAGAIGATAVSIGATALQDWRTTTSTIERNQLYFYVAAREKFRAASAAKNAMHQA